MIANVQPTPTDEERGAILAALSSPGADDQGEGGWAAAALVEGVDEGEPDHP